MAWIQRVVENPEKEAVQKDGRIRRPHSGSYAASLPARVEEMEGRHLRMVLLADGQTVRDAFFDRSVTP